MPQFDVVVMGAGHNGLVAAAYLAKAGKSVLVLERASFYGGGVVTREITLPGFHHDTHSSSHVMLAGNPMMTEDELGLLSRFGLKYVAMNKPQATLFADGSHIVTHRNSDQTCESIAKLSEKDAETYRRFAAQSEKLLPMFLQGMYAPPAPTGPFLAMLSQSPEGRDIFQMMTRSPLDFVDDMFENEQVKIHMLKPSAELLHFPDEGGTAMGLFLFPALMHKFGSPKPIGGSGKLSDALVQCIRHFGGEVVCNREVRKVLTSGDRAVGLETTDGEQYMARDAVIAAIHPKVLDRFVDGLAPPLIKRAKAGKFSSFNVLQVHMALDKPLEFRAGKSLESCQMVQYCHTDRLSEFLKEYDPLRHGEIPANQILSGQDQTRIDSTRAPAGKGIAFTQAFVPYRLAEGGAARWDEVKHEVGEQALEGARKFVSNLDDGNILAREVQSPLDHERDSPNSFVEGDIHGLGGNFFQSGGNRPTPELSDYRVPGVKRLYLVGPFMHPGGSVFGAGRNTVMNVFSDIGLNFDRVRKAAV
ncbi:phytoene dehydrogenase [Caballeronia megalochromosomata]|nr:phytoene dehydrogenase [Caballeronia megalochromosomata]